MTAQDFTRLYKTAQHCNLRQSAAMCGNLLHFKRFNRIFLRILQSVRFVLIDVALYNAQWLSSYRHPCNNSYLGNQLSYRKVTYQFLGQHAECFSLVTTNLTSGHPRPVNRLFFISQKPFELPFLKKSQKEAYFGEIPLKKNVLRPHNMGYGWCQIQPLRSVEVSRGQNRFSSPIKHILASTDLYRPHRLDLTPSVPHIVGSRNIFYLMIHPQKMLPSMTF